MSIDDEPGGGEVIEFRTEITEKRWDSRDTRCNHMARLEVDEDAGAVKCLVCGRYIDAVRWILRCGRVLRSIQYREEALRDAARQREERNAKARAKRRGGKQ